MRVFPSLFVAVSTPVRIIFSHLPALNAPVRVLLSSFLMRIALDFRTDLRFLPLLQFYDSTHVSRYVYRSAQLPRNAGHGFGDWTF